MKLLVSGKRNMNARLRAADAISNCPTTGEARLSPNSFFSQTNRSSSMNRPVRFVVAIAAITTLTGVIASMSGCRNQIDSPKQATAAELSQMNKDFAKALLAKDAAAASMLYTEDASLLPPNEAIVTGRKNIQQYWQGAIDAGIIDVSVATIATGSNGDLGYEIGQYQMTIRQPDGQALTEKGKYAELLKRNENGTWKSIYGIWNADPLPSK
jgi:ketosteroid isomerase-like protein